MFSPYIKSWLLLNCIEEDDLLKKSLIIGGCILFGLILFITSIIYIKNKQQRAQKLARTHPQDKNISLGENENGNLKEKISKHDPNFFTKTDRRNCNFISSNFTSTFISNLK